MFSGDEGDELATELTDSTLTSARLRYRGPGGGTLLDTNFDTSGSRNQETLTSSGTHKIEIDPVGPVTGSVSLSATLTAGDGPHGLRGGGQADGREPSGASAPLAPSTAPAPLPSLASPAAPEVAARPVPGGTRRSVGQRPRGRPLRRPRRPRATHARRASRHANVRAAARRRHAYARASVRTRHAHASAATARTRPAHAPTSATRRHAARRSVGQHAAAPSASGQPKLLQRLAGWRSSAPASWRPTRANRHGTWTADRADSPWTRLAPLQAPAGTTALAGQALRVDGTPLRGVHVTLEHTDASARTDRTGRFLLTGADAGRHVLIVDGRHVGGRRYGIYEIRVELAAGKTTALPYTVWLTQLDPAGDARVPVPTRRATVLTNPSIPGLEVHLPAGSRITDADGRAVRDLNLTAIAVDRPPFPLPDGTNVPAYFTAQPGRAYLSKGARIIYPNYHQLPPYQRVAFWNYDADDRGWYVYGYGEVTADARQVVPDPGVRIWEFTGAMATTSAPAPGSGPNAGGGAGGGDPVDLGTGLFVYRKTDLALPDAVPATLQRIYRPGDSNIYGLGRGTTTPYDIRLWNVSSYTVVQMILPDGGTIDFDRTSSGSDWQSGVFEQRTTPGPWFGALIRRMPNVDGWELHRRDGAVYEFGSGYGPVTAIQDPDGNRLTIDRSQGTTGLMTRLTTEHGRWMRFTYDRSNLATTAVDNAGRRVSYTYDRDQRLETVTDADGGVTTFTYNSAGQMTAIEDARDTTFLQNRYDSDGRVIEQTLADRGTYAFDYTLDRSGRKVTSTTVTDPRGVDETVDFDTAGLPVQDTRAVGSADEQTTRFERRRENEPDRSGRRPARQSHGADLQRRLERHRGYAARRHERRADDQIRLRGECQAAERGGPGRQRDEIRLQRRRPADVRSPTPRRTTTIGYNGSGRKPAWVRDAAGQRDAVRLRRRRPALGHRSARAHDQALGRLGRSRDRRSAPRSGARRARSMTTRTCS